MYIPLSKDASLPPNHALHHAGNSVANVMATVWAQTVHQPSNTGIHKREEMTAPELKQRNSHRWWYVVAPSLMILFIFVALLFGERRYPDPKVGEGERTSSRRSVSRSRTYDSIPLRPYVSNGRLPRPTGKMGPARAALGATVPRKPLPNPSPQIPRYARGRDTVRIGAARAALGATIKQATARATSGSGTNPPQPLRFEHCYITTESGTRVVSRPVRGSTSQYSLRPGETVVQMAQRIERELEEEMQRYPIFRSSLPRRPTPAVRTQARSTGPLSLNEGVQRQVATFPIFQQSSRVQPTRNSGTGTGMAGRERTDEDLRRHVATLPMFQGPASYIPIRRPGPVAPGSATPGFMTPPPAYKNAAGYNRGTEARGDQGEDVQGSREDTVGDEGNAGLGPSPFPPAYLKRNH